MKLGIKFESAWKPLFRPKKHCKYVNDHTIYKSKVGNFHLLGTCADSYSLFSENFFVRGKSSGINNEMVEDGTLFKSKIYTGPKIAPYVFYNQRSEDYHLFFGPMIIRHYVSPDGVTWRKVGNAVNGVWPGLRDPHVTAYKNYYLMYLTDYGNQISVFKSTNLFEWKKQGIALKVGKNYPRSLNSSCESPFVLKVNKGFLLLTTIVPGRFHKEDNLKYYNNTVVFYSEDPFDFGTLVVANIEAHAPEVIQENGKLYITSCGWKGFPKPTGIVDEGVFIRNISLYEY